MAPESQDEGGLSISRRKVLQASGAAAVGSVAFTGTASANCPCEAEDGHDCVELGKITDEFVDSLERGDEEVPFTLMLDGDLRVHPDCKGNDKEVTVLVTPTKFKGDEVTCVELKIEDTNGACGCADDGLYLCGAEVKGGTEFATYDCQEDNDKNQEFSKLTGVCAPLNENSGNLYGISHINVHVCVFDAPFKTEEKEGCAKDGGS